MNLGLVMIGLSVVLLTLAVALAAISAWLDPNE